MAATDKDVLKYLLSKVKSDPRHSESYKKLTDAYVLTASGLPPNSYLKSMVSAMNDFDSDLVDELAAEQNPDLKQWLEEHYPNSDEL